MKEVSLMAAQLMAASARTAPKAGGKDFLAQRQTREKPMGYSGPHCVMRMLDIGVALGSAAKTAGLLNVDNRIQQRVGAAARDLGDIQADVVMGVPVSITGKSIFYDRKAPSISK
jgi:uncharacterized ferredoxin-like protein